MTSVEGVGKRGEKLAEEREEWREVVTSGEGWGVGRWMNNCADGGLEEGKLRGSGRGRTR